MAEFGQNFQKQRFFETRAFPGCFFVTDGHIDVRLGANERPFGSFGHIGLPEIGRIWPKLPKTAVFRNMRVSKLYLCMVEEACELVQMKALGVYMCLLTLSATGSWLKMSKSCDFSQHGTYEIVNTPLNGGGGNCYWKYQKKGLGA